MPHPPLPKHLQLLLLVFLAANLTHFIHNAEYIAYYPGMPSWLTREHVYLVWVAGASLGLSGLLVYPTKLKALGLALVAAYGAQGMDGLAHYTLALCSEHTRATNLTIWFEVLAGLSLLLPRRCAAPPRCRLGWIFEQAFDVARQLFAHRVHACSRLFQA